MTPTAIPPEPGTGVNAAHPDDDDPSKFFGDDNEGEGEGEQPVSLMPDDDDGEAAAEAAAGGEPDANDADGEQEQEQEQPGDGERPPQPAGGIEPTSGQQFDEGTGQREVTGDGAAAPAAESTAEEPAVAAPAAESAAEPQPAAAVASPAEQGSKEPPAEPQAAKPANGPRGYVVLREVELTHEFLEHFLKELDAGKDPRTAYFVLEPKVESRNPTPVLQAAFKKHHKRLGEPLRLGAIPLSMFKIRSLSLKPKVIDDNIVID